MDKLITAEEAKALNEAKESLRKAYKTINRLIKEAALDGQLNFFDTEDIVQILADEIKPAIVRNLRIRTSESKSRLYYGNKLFTGEITFAIPKE